MTMARASIGKMPSRRRALALMGLLLILLLSACGGTGGAPPTATAGIGKIGEKAVTAQVGLTVNSVERKDLIGEASRPGQGNIFVVLDVTIDNGTDHKVSYTRYHFTLTDSSGRVYEPAAVPGQGRPLLASELDAKKDVSGAIVFRVPVSAGPLELVYQAPGSSAPLRVDLGA